MNQTTNERTGLRDRRTVKKLLLSAETLMGFTGNYVETMLCCHSTGIKFAVGIPAVLKGGFDDKAKFYSPLADFHFARELLNLDTRELRELDVSFLAGLFLSIYKGYALVEGRDCAIKQNALLSTVDKEVLITALVYSRGFAKIKKSLSLVAKLDIDYETHKEGIADFTEELANHLERIEECLVHNSVKVKEADGSGIITVFGGFDENVEAQKTKQWLKNEIDPNTPSDYDVSFGKMFALNRSKAVKAYAVISPMLLKADKVKLNSYLKMLLSSDNSLTTNQATKQKVIAILSDLTIELPIEVSVLITTIVSFLDMQKADLVTVSELLETAIEPVKNNKSMAERIADKKYQESLKASAPKAESAEGDKLTPLNSNQKPLNIANTLNDDASFQNELIKNVGEALL